MYTVYQPKKSETKKGNLGLSWFLISFFSIPVFLYPILEMKWMLRVELLITH